MTAYVIADVQINDPVLMEEYVKLAGESLAPYKWKPIVFGGAVEAVEGNWNPKHLVVLEFESMEQAKQWYGSPEYVRAKEIRLRAASTNVVFVEGV